MLNDSPGRAERTGRRLAPATHHDSLFPARIDRANEQVRTGSKRIEPSPGDDEKGYAMAQKPTSMSSDEAIATTPDSTEPRDVLASKLVDRFAIWSGVAGLVPIPVIDVLAVGGLQFSENRGKSLIAALAGTMIPATSGMGAASALKAVPVLGMLASAFVMPALSAGATFAIGKAFIQHFESGGTLLDFNPPDHRDFVKAQKEMWNSRSTARRAEPSSSSP